MPTYQVSDPETGRTLKLTGDSPPTEQELEQIFAQQMQQQAPEAKDPQIAEPTKYPTGLALNQQAAESQMLGMRDPINAAAQMLEKALPQGVSDKINEFNNWLVEQGVPLEVMPKGGFDQYLREQEAQYQEGRGDTGIDVNRMAGNIASPMFVGVAKAVPAVMSRVSSVAPKMASTILKSPATQTAGVGAASGALTPVTEGDDFLEEKAKQVAIGTGTAGAIHGAGKAISRVISPESTPQVQKLLKEGVKPTPGQALGGFAKTVEDSSRSIPLVGEVISQAQKRANVSFNKAVLNRALKPIGKKLGEKQVPDKDALSFVNETISDAYDEVLPKLRGKIDGQFKRQLGKLRGLVKSMPDDKYNQFEKILKYDVTDRFTKDGLASGRTLKEIESQLGQQIKGYIGSQNYDDRRLGQALREVQSQLRLMVSRQNPKYKGKLKQINKAYGEFKLAERAQTYTGGETDFFTAAQYNSAVKAKDISKDKRLFSQGRAKGQDLSSAGKDVLSSKIPDSGTTGRALVGGALLGAGAINPANLIAPAAVAVPYLPKISDSITAIIAKRPELAKPLALELEKLLPNIATGVSSESARQQ